MKKAFRAAFGLALVLIVVALGVVSLSLGRLVKTAVETAGPRVLGAPVTLGLATVAPWSGRGSLRRLVIGAPKGFKSPRSISAGAVELHVKLSSLLTDTIVVESLVIREPEIVWEMGAGGGSNLTALQRNAEAAAASLGGPSAPAAPEPAKKGKSLLIKELVVTGGRVGLTATAFDSGTLSAPLPDVRLTNLGGPGHSPAETAAQALAAVTGATQSAVRGMSAKTLDAAAAAARNLFKNLQLFKKGEK